MSNPLLRPDDPRFRRPALRDEAGKNPFGDDLAAADAPATAADAFATSGDEARPFEARFAAQQAPRTGLLLALAGCGWTGAALGALALIKWPAIGWICPLLGLPPAVAAALLAWEEWKAIGSGAIDARHRGQTRLALWLGILAMAACAGLVGAMIYGELPFLPDLL